MAKTKRMAGITWEIETNLSLPHEAGIRGQVFFLLDSRAPRKGMFFFLRFTGAGWAASKMDRLVPIEEVWVEGCFASLAAAAAAAAAALA